MSRHSKWLPKLPMIRQWAGQRSAQEIADALGTSVANLYQICHVHGISLRRPGVRMGRKPAAQKTPEDPPPGQTDAIEDARRLLLDAGYRVLSPDPFGPRYQAQLARLQQEDS